MITHASYLAVKPTIFAAPIGILLNGIMADVPRYEEEKRICVVAARAKNGVSKATLSMVIDVVKNAPIILDAIERKHMDTRSVTIAVNGKRTSVYAALHQLLAEGIVAEVRGKMPRGGYQSVYWEMK